jgi:hypothetical protein
MEFGYTGLATFPNGPDMASLRCGMLRGIDTTSLDGPMHILANEILKDPKRSYETSSREVESLLASVFREALGYAKVALTKQTRDGGFDIVGIEAGTDRKVLIEVKNWTRPVGLAIVDRLLGVLVREGVQDGIIVTTSRFSRDATGTVRKRNIGAAGYRIDLKDQVDILSWLEVYCATDAALTELDFINEVLSRTGGHEYIRRPLEYNSPPD